MSEDTVTIEEFITAITKGILNPIITLLFVVAIIVFVWGIVRYVIGAQGDTKQVETAKKAIFWGIIGMFVMASAFGIVNLLCNFFGTCDKI